MIDIWGGVITVLLDRCATAAVAIVPSSHNDAWPMSHIRKNCNFALYHVASGSLCISGDPCGHRRLRLDFHNAGLDLERLRWRNSKRLILRYLERLALDDTNFG